MDISMTCQMDFSTISPAVRLWENPHMQEDAKSRLRERVSERLAATGKSKHAVSIEIGANAGYVRDLLDPEKSSMPGGDKLTALAAALQTTTEYLLGTSDDAAQVRSEVSLSDRRFDWKGPQPDEPGIPLVGTGDCADLEFRSADGELVSIERSSFDPDYHIRMIERPPALRGSKDIYAIYFHGSSMEPRFEAGEIGLVDPRRPAGPGDYVLVQLSDGESDEVVSVLVKRMVRQNSRELVLEQFNPSCTFTVPKRKVARVHRILQQTDLLF